MNVASSIHSINKWAQINQMFWLAQLGFIYLLSLYVYSLELWFSAAVQAWRPVCCLLWLTAFWSGKGEKPFYEQQGSDFAQPYLFLYQYYTNKYRKISGKSPGCKCLASSEEQHGLRNPKWGCGLESRCWGGAGLRCCIASVSISLEPQQIMESHQWR